METKNICTGASDVYPQPMQVVNLPYRVYESFKGRYFMGHTPFITMGDHYNGWGGLINPISSGINMYINTFTVSNTSDTPFRAELWLNAKPFSKATVSPHVSPANTAIEPLPTPKAVLVFASHLKECPSSGVSIFERISEANSTVVGNYYGKIIIPPGGSFIVYLHSPNAESIKADIAFGWWEEQRHNMKKGHSKCK